MRIRTKLTSWLRTILDSTIFTSGVFGNSISAIVLLVSFLCFQQSDLLHTAGASLAILDGHIIDFYDHVAQTRGYLAYLPSSYFVFAVWNLPIKLLNLAPPLEQFVPPYYVTMYYKLLPGICYFLSAFVVYKILQTLNVSETASKHGAYLWFSMPIAFFSVFIFGQYDVFTLLLSLIGIYYYLKGKDIYFILAFGVALTFKYYSLLLFVPLLVLKEKRVEQLIGNILLYLLPFALVTLPFISSPAFHKGVFGFFAPQFILQDSLPIYYFGLKHFLVLWLGLIGWAYLVDTSDLESLFKWCLFISSTVMFLLFGLSFFHPQWLILATPFWVMGTLYNKRRDVLVWLDMLMMVVLTAYMVHVWPNIIDETLFNLGLLKRISMPILGSSVTMRDMFFISDVSLTFSLFSGLVLVRMIANHPNFLTNDPNTIRFPNWLMQLRFNGGVGIFILPAFLSLALSLVAPKITFTRENAILEPTNPLSVGNVLSQVFTPEMTVLDQLKVKIRNNTPENESHLQVEILDNEGKLLYQNSYDAINFLDNEYKTFCLPHILVNPDSRYEIRFSASGTSETENISLYRTAEDVNSATDFAILNGVPQAFDLDIKIYESKSSQLFFQQFIPCRE